MLLLCKLCENARTCRGLVAAPTGAPGEPRPLAFKRLRGEGARRTRGRARGGNGDNSIAARIKGGLARALTGGGAAFYDEAAVHMFDTRDAEVRRTWESPFAATDQLIRRCRA